VIYWFLFIFKTLYLQNIAQAMACCKMLFSLSVRCSAVDQHLPVGYYRPC